MSTNILTINPASVGTNSKTSPVSFNLNGGIVSGNVGPDCLEVKNDTPYLATVTVLGVTQQQLVLSPFEHNAWPITELVQNNGLLGKPITIVVAFSHYYASVATENNSPTNICLLNQLSYSEYRTNTYPLYTARMNSTVAIIANSVVNNGDAAGNTIVSAIPSGDTTNTIVITNTGSITLGDAHYIGTLDLLMLGGDSFLLQANGWTQTDSAGANVSTMSDTGILSLGSTNHNGALQITGTGLSALTLNTSGILVVDSAGTTVINESTSGIITVGNANHGGILRLVSTAGNTDIDIETGFNTLNGSTSGTAKLFQWLRGTLKITWILLENFRNGNAGVQNMVLPVAYNQTSNFQVTRFITTNTSPLNALNSGVAQSFGIITGLAAAGGSVTVQTQLNKFSIADQINPFDTISFLGSQASAFNGLVEIIGY